MAESLRSTHRHRPAGHSLHRPRLTIRETHLAKKALPMRLPTSTHRRNPLKTSNLQRDELNSTHPNKMRLPGGVTDRPRALRPPMNPDKRGLKLKFLSVFIHG